MMNKNTVLIVVGLMLAAFNIGVVGTVATGAVDGAVDSMFQTYTKDEICEDEDCTELSEDWLTSTSERDYYAWNLTNLDAILADFNVDAVYDQVGPVTYEISTERTLINHDAEAGTITYSEINTYDWKDGVSSTTPITALNILYEPQRVGAVSLAVNSAYASLIESVTVENGTNNVSEDAMIAFGAENPVNGGYEQAGLNMGGIWGMANPVVNLSLEQSQNILFGPLAITGDAAVLFLYGEVSGHTVSINPMTMAPDANGIQLEWNDSTVAMLYGIDENAAAALRFFVGQTMFNGMVPTSLAQMFGATKYVSHTVDQWLFGWRDPLMAQLEGDVMDLSMGWQSLETNKTYFGSPNVSTGNGTTYTVCTGENPSCDTGETLLQDGSPNLFWRTPEMEVATFGEIGVESLAGTSGGFITGSGDLLNLGDYAVVSPERQDDGEYLGLPVEVWTASVAPGERSIQAKLTNQQSLVDIFPGAVPIYFAADVELKVQPDARIIISGESTSYFYLDTRFMSEQATSPPTESDLQPVFKIETGGGADQDTVDQMQSGIIDNQKQLTYWTNFDTDASSFFIDQITLVIYLAAIGTLIFGLVGMVRDEENAESLELGTVADTALDDNVEN